MKTLELPDALKAVRCDDLFASIAALWESRPERVADVTEQVRAIHDKLIEWGWETVDREELDHATICYSRAVGSYECCEWLPFDVMPGWEDDLYCLLMDEERWQEYREANRCTSELAATLRREANEKGEARRRITNDFEQHTRPCTSLATGKSDTA